MILIIASADDIHALSVCREVLSLREDASIAIFDSASFPLNSRIEITPYEWQLTDADGRTFRSSDISALWWRRALPHNVSDTITDPAARRFALNECAHAFNAISYWPGYLKFNDVGKEREASLKPIQIRCAAECGLDVPSTLVTNDPDSVERFCFDSTNTIFKTLTPPVSTFGETRRFKEEHRSKLPSLIHAPSIFQSEIVKKKDVRVTVVGEEMFTAYIETKNPSANNFPDWRLDASAECHEYDLPIAIKSKIFRLMRALGLLYGAIDLIETEDGQFIFLEVNPSGQFLFVEIDTGQKISAAIAKLLLSN